MGKIKSIALRHFETTLIVIIFLGIIAIAFLVQYNIAFLNVFLLPVILAGYYLGKREAVLSACLCVLLVTLYLIFTQVLLKTAPRMGLDEVLNVITWGGFLILTGGIIGIIAEQREARLKRLEGAYMGMLEILLKYLEAADEKKPHSLRVSWLAGKVAERIGLPMAQVENIKSAALLLEAGDLRANLPLYEQVARFMEQESLSGEKKMDKEKVLLKTTASLLKEVEPLLTHYFRHYVEEANVLDKKLEEIPLGSSIIALADLYDRLSAGVLSPQWKDTVTKLEDLRKLSGRAFPAAAVQALLQAVGKPHLAEP